MDGAGFFVSSFSVLFVCMGNICRSPTAEGVFRHMAETAGLDPRSRAVAARRGYDLSAIRARKVSAEDFERFELILAMDVDNLRSLRAQCPAGLQHKLQLLLAFSRRFPDTNVPDPYYGGAGGFERVLDMVEDAGHGLLEHVRSRLGSIPG